MNTPTYQTHFVYLPQTASLGMKRNFFNQKSLASSDKEFIYRHFTGRGRLHNLSRKNYGSFREYTDAKQSFEMGQFFTPDEICRTVIEMLEIEQGKIVADICSGKGSFFNYLKENRLYGVEIDEDAWRISKKLFPEANIQHADMRKMQAIPKCDYIVGNPPFDIPFYDLSHPFAFSDGKVLSQSYYLAKCYESLKKGGFLGFVCPHFRKHTANRQVKHFFWKHFNILAAIYLPEGIFSQSGTDVPTKFILAQKKPDVSEKQTTAFFQTTFSSRVQTVKEWRSSLQYTEFLKLKRKNSHK